VDQLLSLTTARHHKKLKTAITITRYRELRYTARHDTESIGAATWQISVQRAIKCSALTNFERDNHI